MVSNNDSNFPEGFMEFWHGTLHDSRFKTRPPVIRKLSGPVRTLDQFDVRFTGFEGEEIAAWLSLPSGRSRPLQCIIEYVGYGAGRGYAHEHTFWASCGFAHFVVDVRGQGGQWRRGDTPDTGNTLGSDSFFTRGVLNPYDYYYRRLYTDAVLAVDAVRTFEAVDQNKVFAYGISQGGALALVAGSLNSVTGVLADVPALAAFEKGMLKAEQGPYVDLAEFLSTRVQDTKQILETLAYFDTAIISRLAKSPCLLSLGKRDIIVPPEVVRDVHDNYGGDVELIEYPFSGHQGGGAFHLERQLSWLTNFYGEQYDY